MWSRREEGKYETMHYSSVVLTSRSCPAISLYILVYQAFAWAEHLCRMRRNDAEIEVHDLEVKNGRAVKNLQSRATADSWKEGPSVLPKETLMMFVESART